MPPVSLCMPHRGQHLQDGIIPLDVDQPLPLIVALRVLDFLCSSQVLRRVRHPAPSRMERSHCINNGKSDECASNGEGGVRENHAGQARQGRAETTGEGPAGVAESVPRLVDCDF